MDNTDVVLFDFGTHFSAITNHHLNRRMTGEKRYVLFILDSSGSIGITDFTKMKEILGNLVPLFCKETKFAVMSYGDKIVRDICFSCDQNETYNFQFLNALHSIEYHNGPSTRTGDAIRCACDYMLQASCGHHREADSITDVIIITDGHYNKGENPCFAARCFQSAYNVIPIAIGESTDYDELSCIEGDNGPTSGQIFDVRDIEGLEALYNSTLAYLNNSTINERCRKITK